MWQHLRIYSKPYRKRYGSTWTRGKVPDRVGIENRPAIVDRKTRIGDWEADTIVGKNQKSALLTFGRTHYPLHSSSANWIASKPKTLP